MTSIKKIALAGLCAFGASGAVNANATPTLEISLAETGYTTVTQTGSTPLVLVESFGTFLFTVDIGSATEAPSLDLDSLAISTSTAGTLVVTLSASGFTSPTGAASWLSQFSGNFGTGSATVELQTYLNNDNTLLSLTDATLLGTLTATTTPFAVASLANASTDGSFALTEVMTITTTGPAQLSLDGSIGVPEPASMALLGVGMISTGVVARRRRQSTTTPA